MVTKNGNNGHRPMYDIRILYTNGGFHGHGGTPKWLVYKFVRGNPTKVDELGVPPFRKPPITFKKLS